MVTVKDSRCHVVRLLLNWRLWVPHLEPAWLTAVRPKDQAHFSPWPLKKIWMYLFTLIIPPCLLCQPIIWHNLLTARNQSKAAVDILYGTYLVVLFQLLQLYFNEFHLIQITLSFGVAPLCFFFFLTTSEWAVCTESVERGGERNVLFSSIVLDYRIKVDSQDTEQHYPLILCFGFK